MALAWLQSRATNAIAIAGSDLVVATANEAEVQDLSKCARLAESAYLNEAGRKVACQEQSLTFIDGVNTPFIHAGAMFLREVLAGSSEAIDDVSHAATTLSREVVLGGSSEAGDGDVASWFLAEDSHAFYLVFEGTSNVKDVLVDLLASPSDDLPSCHNGFQLGCSPRLNKRLYATIQSNLDGSPKDLYVIGHSLGGAYAMIVAQKYLDDVITHSGSRHVFMFGAPKVFNGALHGPPTLKGSATLVVNHDDLVPRLLGQTGPISDFIYEQSRRLTLDLLGNATRQGQRINTCGDEQRSLRGYGGTNALSQYVHPEGIQLFVLRNEEIQKPIGHMNENHLNLTLGAVKILSSDDKFGEVKRNHAMANYLRNIQEYGKKGERRGLIRALNGEYERRVRQRP